MKRLPGFAGSFYPGDRESLNSKLQDLFRKAKSREAKGKIVGLVSPHAGYPFSGVIAATGFKTIQNLDIKKVIIIGPSHQVPFTGMAVFDKGVWVTPLGEVKIDEKLAKKIIDSSPIFISDPDVHLGEHSIEVQIPFLQYIFKDFTIVPIMMGIQDESTVVTASEGLANVLKDEEDFIVIASSDLYHGYSVEECEKYDAYTVGLILKGDEREIIKEANSGRAMACGAGPIATVVGTLKRLSPLSIQLLSYTNSAKVTGAFSGYVVGYASVAISKIEQEDEYLTKEEKEYLIQVAKEAVYNAIRGRGYSPPPPPTEKLARPSGVFVTLKINGMLRGCIGYVLPVKPLYVATSQVAADAAVNDPRFPSVSVQEFDDLEFEISVLTPLEKVDNIDEIVVGKHGLMIRSGYYQGVLLPQVPVEYGWDRYEFLDNTCLKAGLSRGCWKEPGVEIYKFSAYIFTDKDLQ